MTLVSYPVSRLSTQQHFAVWIICCLISLITSIIASPDSGFTHSSLCHIDTAWFMDAGRWMMQGLTPYVDFSDSKGPLLWLFYGIGYLMDPGGWQGMFWLYAIYYVFVYQMVWRVVYELLGNNRFAAIATLCMPLFFLLLGHAENRAEDLFHLPFLYLLYLLVRQLKGEKVKAHSFFIVGSGVGILLFVKWNFPIIMLPAIASILYFKYRSGGKFQCLLKPVGLILAGCMAVVLPVLIWMYCTGSLQALFNEYFLATFHTGLSSESSMSLIDTLSVFSRRFTDFLYFNIFIVCSSYVGYKLYGKRGLVFPLLLILLCLFYSIHYIDYYAQIDRGYGLFVPVALILLFCRLRNKRLSRDRVVVICVIVFVAVCGVLYMQVSRGHENFGHDISDNSFVKMSHRISRIKNPRILYLNDSDIALGIESEALPPCKYWAGQYGMTPSMTADQRAAMRRHTADIVVCDMETTEPLEYGYIHEKTDICVSSYPSSGYYCVYWSPEAYAQISK